jgi:hypothetical protein
MELIQRNRRTAWRRVEDEVVIVSSETNALTILNETAGRVWELLGEPRTYEELATALSLEFDVEVGQARRDVADLVADLRLSKLIDSTEAK